MPKSTPKSDEAGPAGPARTRGSSAKQAKSDKAGKAKASGTPDKAPRLPARKTFLIAATMPDGGTKPELRVYASVRRSPAEALAAVRAELGDEVAVELTGKLSNRMAKTLGLKADEVRQI